MACIQRTFRRAVIAALLCAAPAGGWDSKIHPGIVRAALGALPAEDRLRERWGDEAWRLQQYVQLGDWVNAVVMQQEQWHVGGETPELTGVQFYANDFLIFPGVPRPFQHMAPAVQGTYRPFFLRAVQAMRMETPENAARWVGSLLHFITDSGSPPHTIGVTGPNHTRMESGFDTRLIDLTGYRPQVLGDNADAALKGLIARMDGLLAFSAIRAKQMLPYAESNDRAKLDGPALESATETARVTADVIHTLLHLTIPARGASLTAQFTAPAVDGMDNLPAKLLFLGTPYSTLSTQMPPAFHTYRGVFSVREIPPGNYRVAVERPGAEPFRADVTLKAGEELKLDWRLAGPRVTGNLVLNPDLELRWVTSEAPDHWHYDAAGKQWVSDNIPVIGGMRYRTGGAGKVGVQWMSHAWDAMKLPARALDGREEMMRAPDDALFARFVVPGSEEPSALLKGLYFARVQ